MNRICTTFVFLFLVLKNTFEVFGQVPKVFSFLPSNGAVGSILTISGANFSAIPSNNKVSFGGIAASVNAASATHLTLAVPSGASYNYITVETNGLVAVSTSAFDVTGTCTGLSSFAAKTDYATGTYPNAVTVGDFNGDGKQDLVFANSGNNSVSVLLGLGGGLFGSKTDYPTGTQPSSVAVGDFNADGKQDLVTSDTASNSVSVLFGTGIGTFGLKNDYQTDTGPFSVAVGDFNGDGIQDLATANYGSNTISLLFGIGGGNFSARSDFTTQTGPHSIAVGDFNKDGNQDLVVVGDNANVVSVHQGNGLGSFVLVGNYPVGSGGFSVSVGEFNGDGNQDLAVINANSNSISVLLGTGLGTFGTQTQYAVGLSPNLVTIGDFNGDGNQDLVSANYDSDSISVLLGTGSGTFGSRKDYSTGTSPVSIAVGDFNNDGQQDVVTANNNAVSASVLLNSCSPSPPAGNVLSYGPGNNFVVAGPINLAATDFTIEFWVKRAPSSQGANNLIISQGQLPASTNNFLDLGIDNGSLYLEFWNNRISNPGIFDSNWHHVAFTALSTGQRSIYVDGVQTISDANTGAYTGYGNLFIGCESNTYGAPFEGSLDELAIWQTVRTQAQIQGDMLGFINPATATGLVAYYDFNQGVPGGDNTTPPVNTLNDAFGNHGILNGFTLNGNISNWINSGSYLSVPVINSFTPVSGQVGTIVTVYGTNFDLVPANNIVNFNGAATTASSSNTNYLVVTVPSGASTGLITVSVAGQSGTSISAFTILAPSQPLGNRGIYFDGTPSENAVQRTVFSNITDNVSMSAWIKLQKLPSSTNAIVLSNGDANLNGYAIVIESNTTTLGIVNGGQNILSTNLAIPINQWVHVAISRDAGVWKYYLNGVSGINTNPGSVPDNFGPLSSPTGNFFVGNLGIVPNPFIGQIDEVRFFNSSRAPAQILSDMGSSVANGAVAYWNFEEANGSTTNDLSGNGYVGILSPNLLRAIRVTDNTDNGAVGLGSLRQAINDANTDLDKDYIDFSLPSGTQTIQPTTTYTLNNPVLIDGFSQLNTIPGENSMANSNAFGQPINSKLNIVINGALAGSSDAFLLASNNAEIKGLVVNGFSNSSGFNFSNAYLNVDYNKISGCFIGTNRNGTAAVPNMFGFQATGPSSIRAGNIIGGVNQEDRNLISGNSYMMADFNPWSNGLIQNNYIGTDALGNSAIPNTNGAISGLIWSSNTTITGNVISGNGGDGINIGSNFPSNYIISGNRIGTLADGTGSLPNNGNGISIYDNNSNTIGGSLPSDQNIIANNTGYGIFVSKSTAINNKMAGNAIFNNTLGGINLSSGGNNNKPSPAISNAFTNQVNGTCQSGDLVEVFYDSPQFGSTNQGRVYLGQATTTGINWSFAATLTIGSRITATATDGVNGTSPFSIADTVINPISGAALNFDGVNDYVATNLWSTALKNITMEASVYWNGTTGANQQIMLNGNSGANGYGITIQGGAGGDALSILQGGSAWISSGVVLSKNNWHHIAAVNDNGTWTLYLDGNPLSIVFNTAIPNSITGVSNSYIGSNQLGQENFNGTIDNIRFWNRPLCQAEINAHLACEKPSNTAGLIAKYDFNEGYAGGINSSVTSLVDSSGNGNTGTLTGFALTGVASNWVSPGAVISGSTCSGLVIIANSTWTWLGNSTDWFSPCNWDKLSVPIATSDVVIPGGTTFAPTITGSPAFCNTISINSDNGGVVNLDTSGGGVLNVKQ